MGIPTLDHIIAYLNLLTTVQLRALVIIAVSVAAYLVTSVTIRFFVRFGKLPSQSFSWLKWVFLLVILSYSETYLTQEVDPALLDKPMFVMRLVVTYLMVRSLISGFYHDLWLKRVKKQSVNPIYLDLLKIFFLLIIIASAFKGLFDLDMGSMVTSSAILTAIIGFSMQDTIGSLFSGLLIQTEKPFNPGDWINIDGQDGKVIETTWRYTKIQTIERDTILVPNNSISKARLLNYSRPISEVQQRIYIGVPLHVPPVKVKAALEDVLNKSSLILNEPPPVIRFAEIAADRANYLIAYFVRDYEHRFAAKDELNSAIWYEFKKMDIELPYPTQELVLSRRRQQYNMGETLEVLQDVPMFTGLGEQELSLLAQTAAVETYAPGMRILTEGDMDTTLYILLRGKVEVRQDGVNLTTLESGSFFGEMALLTGEARQADVYAIEPCRCMVVDRQCFKILLERDPSIIANINEIFRSRSEQGKHIKGTCQINESSLFKRFKDIFL